MKYDTLETQTSPKGRPYRSSGVEKIPNGWRYTFKFLDQEGGFFTVTEINGDKKFELI